MDSCWENHPGAWKKNCIMSSGRLKKSHPRRIKPWKARDGHGWYGMLWVNMPDFYSAHICTHIVHESYMMYIHFVDMLILLMLLAALLVGTSFVWGWSASPGWENISYNSERIGTRINLHCLYSKPLPVCFMNCPSVVEAYFIEAPHWSIQFLLPSRFQLEF